MTKTKITASAALDALVAAGFIPSYRRVKEYEYDNKVTGFKAKSEKLEAVSNETYGKKSYLYFYCKNSNAAYELIRIIREAGGRPGTGWNGGPDRGCVDLRVSYFKGSRWWE